MPASDEIQLAGDPAGRAQHVLGVLVVADLTHLVTSPFPQDPSQGSFAFAVVAAALPSLLVLLCAWATLRALGRRSASTPYPLAIAAWTVAFQGLSDIDVVYLYGYGFPAYRGGPMFWAENEVGLKTALEKLNKYADGKWLKVSPLLEQLVAEGKGFASVGQ